MVGNDCLAKLSKKPLFLKGEPFWSFEDALEVANELSAMRHAILGVELYVQAGDSPRWIASSNYAYGHGFPWNVYVDKCLRGAEEFIFTNKGSKEGIFNFAVVKEQEWRALKPE